MVAGQHQSSICRSFFQKCFIISEFDRMNSRNQFSFPLTVPLLVFKRSRHHNLGMFRFLLTIDSYGCTSIEQKTTFDKSRITCENKECPKGVLGIPI